MKGKMRNSGIDIIGNVPWGTHFCQFYQTKKDLMDILVPYFKAGLENNEFCFWVTSQPLEVEEAKEALRRVIPDIDVYLERKQIEIIPYTCWYVKAGFFDSERVLNELVEKLDSALASGYDGLRVAGSTSWLKKGDWDDFLDYEKKVDANIGERPIISLCAYFLDMCSAADIIDVAFNHQFSLSKREGKWERIENFGQQNITEHKRSDDVTLQSEQRVRLKLDSVLSPALETANLELADIIDTQVIQSLMDDFYKLAHIPMSLDDLKGNVLVGVGWQDICTKFHRVHPEACKHCVESDTKLSGGVSPGEFKLYRCKNNMWDIATPIIVGGQHVGNIFSGQFFFEDEPLDSELFRSQARKYGFNEEEYITALEKVPRLSREAVNTGMSFLTKLANMVSKLSYSNIKLAQSMTERETLLDALRESEEKYRSIVETANEGIWVVDAEDRTNYVNKKMAEMLGYSQEEMIGRSGWDFTDEKSKLITKQNIEKIRQGIDESHEFKLIRKDSSPLWMLVNTKSFFDKDGKFTGSMSMFTDITERKQEEHRIRRYNRILEGINQIFSNVVQAKTEEELGNSCLSVALEVTDSQIGFVNLLGADELLHDVAKSELGWEQCLMYDKTGHRRPPSDFIIHGLYGSVIINEKGFFTNEPLSHPDSIGLPYGHPPITSFLGVPLIQDGKTIGLIAVANREKGYSCEQQEDLEAIAPAVTQALQRKKAEDALRFSNIYNRSLIEASLDPLVTIGPDGKITDVNGATEQVTGYSRNELIGTDFSDYFTEPEKARTGYQQVFKDGEVRDYPLGIQHKDGHITPVLYNASVYRDEYGKIIGVFAAARDITEIQKAEETIQTLANVVESSEDAIITKSLDGIITSWNKGAETVYGYSAEEVLRKDITILEPENLKGEVKLFSEKIKHGEKIQHYETSRLKKDGTIINVSVTLSPVFDASGELVAISTIARDITERKKAEEDLKKAHESLEEKVKERTSELEEAYNSLKESEKRLSEAQERGSIGNWDWDLVTGELYWSDEMYRIYGRNPQKSGATYDELLNYIHPEDRDYVGNVIQKALKEKLFGIDYRIVLANGEERTVHAESEVIFDEKNIPIRAKGIVQDITERKKTEEKIQTLANAVESSNDAIVTVSLDGIITSWNKAAEQIYVYSAEEVLGKDVSILEPDNIEGEIKHFSEKIKQGKQIQHYESSRLKKDGTVINISVTLSPVFDVTGKLVAISGIVRDITERIKAEEALRESEARLRRFYESDMIGVCFYNLNGSITDGNDKFLEIVGYAREDLQVGRVKWDKMTPPEYRQLDERAMAELKSIGMNTPYEKEYTRKDGSRVPIIIGIATFDKVRNEGIAFVLDITEKKKAEEALANLEIARKKEIHHRIKNNLQVISSLLDLQADKFDNPKVIEAFRESQNRVISMALIHEELYKGGGTDTLNFSEYLEKLAENLFQTYSLSSKNIRLFMDLEENAFFNMDTAVPLGIIVNELVSNSLKHAFTKDEDGEIRIKLCREEINDEISKSLFNLTVSDTGKGIPENLEVGSLESLGLQLVNILVDQLDGKIELKREPGAEFKITFNVEERS